jgi:hypothetical protein
MDTLIQILGLVWIGGISHGVWNGGMKFSFPMERLAFLHETQEIKHPLQYLGKF